MRPLEDLPKEEGARIEGLLFDLDDTFLTHGLLAREAYDALWDLHDAGVKLVVVTGRPSSWGRFVVKQWPVDAATTENGAIAIVRDAEKISVVDPCERFERDRRRARFVALVSEMASKAPDLKVTDDASGRISDVTWDIGENERVSAERIAFARSIIASHDARSSCSSVHLHATFDGDDKATGTARLLATQFGVDPGRARSRWAFAGDSGNDRACFAAFHTTFGVANVRNHVGNLSVPPRWVSKSPMGAGFSEIAAAILRCKMR
ncbi:MAG TPA: HAD-IIB family hydrolase [Polyangiaceae bacterium]